LRPLRPLREAILSDTFAREKCLCRKSQKAFPDAKE
jgi:hypothetical protein